MVIGEAGYFFACHSDTVVSIPNKISRGVVPRERLGDLARDPLRGWVCRHAKRHPKSSSVAHNDKTIQSASPETVAASGGTYTERPVDWATSMPSLSNSP